jgi:hypothetical protein
MGEIQFLDLATVLRTLTHPLATSQISTATTTRATGPMRLLPYPATDPGSFVAARFAARVITRR